MYYPYTNYFQQPYYHFQNSAYGSFHETREVDDGEYRPNDDEDAPTTPLPAQSFMERQKLIN